MKSMKQENDSEELVENLETDLSEASNYYQKIIEHETEGVAITDMTGLILECNHAYCEMFGYSRGELIHQHLEQLLHPTYKEQIEEFKRQLKEKGNCYLESITIRKDGIPVTVEIIGFPCTYKGKSAILNIVKNIVRKKRIEFDNLSRLNMMSEMASSLAHELNQPLGAIVNYSKGCLRRMENEAMEVDELKQVIEKVAAQAERAANIVQRLRGFVCYGQLKLIKTDINGIIRQAIGFLETECKAHQVILKTDLAPHLPDILIDQVQIEQVLVNIINNAIEAVKKVSSDQREIIIHSHMLNTQYLEIIVCDQAMQLNENDVEKIFMPFYTTRAHGMGMGLAISRSIVEAHHGRLNVSIDKKTGTCFYVQLPLKAEEE